MEQKAKIISAVVVGVAGYFGIKYLTKGKEDSTSEQATFMGGGSSANPNTDAYVETVPNTVYNVTVESPTAPADFGTATTFAEAPTKKDVAVSSSRSSGSGYFSTNRQTQSTNKEVDFTKTTADSSDRFATNPSTGATIDRYAQQSISQEEATKRATKKVFTPAPQKQSVLPSAGLKQSKAPATTKKEEKSKPAPKKSIWKPSTWWQKMVNNEITQYDDQNNKWWNPLNWGGGYNAQLGQEGDANIGSGLVNVTKKEERIAINTSTQNSDSRDQSTSTIYSPTDVRNLTLTNAPTLVFNSPNATTTGSSPYVTSSPEIAPVVQTKKEQSVSQDSTQKTDQSTGLDLEKIALYVAVAGVVLVLLTGGKKIAKKIPMVKAIKKATKKVSKKKVAKK